MELKQKFIEFEKQSRYYALILHQDLWDTWLVTRIWGRKGSNKRYKHEPYESYEAAFTYMEKLAFYRQQKRKYLKILQKSTK